MYTLDLHGLVSSETYANEANSQDGSGFTALHNAAWAGDPAEVRKLLAHGANPAVEAYNGLTPLELCFWGTEHVNLGDLEQSRAAANALVMKALHAERNMSNNIVRSAFYWALCHRVGQSYDYVSADCAVTLDLLHHLQGMRQANAPSPPTTRSSPPPPTLRVACIIQRLRKDVEELASEQARTRVGYWVILYFLLCSDGEPTVYWMVVLWEVVRSRRKEISMLKANRRTANKMRQAAQTAVNGVVEVVQTIAGEFIGFPNVGTVVAQQLPSDTDAENGELSSLMPVRENVAKHIDELISIKTAFKTQLAEHYPERKGNCGIHCYHGEDMSGNCDLSYFEEIRYFS